MLQISAKAFLGEEKVQFPKFYHKWASDTVGYLYQPDFQFMWNPDWIADTWAIDGFTCDPRDLCSGRKHISFPGWHAKVQQHGLKNASVGRLPTMLVIIAVHRDFGMLLWCTYTGAKAGKKNCWTGYKYWFDDLPEWMKQHIKCNKYYNREHLHGERWLQGCEDKPFDPTLFRVRIHLQATRSTACTNSRNCARQQHCISRTDSHKIGNPKDAAALAFSRSRSRLCAHSQCSRPHTSTPKIC